MNVIPEEPRGLAIQNISDLYHVINFIYTNQSFDFTPGASRQLEGLLVQLAGSTLVIDLTDAADIGRARYQVRNSIRTWLYRSIGVRAVQHLQSVNATYRQAAQRHVFSLLVGAASIFYGGGLRGDRGAIVVPEFDSRPDWLGDELCEQLLPAETVDRYADILAIWRQNNRLDSGSQYAGTEIGLYDAGFASVSASTPPQANAGLRSASVACFKATGEATVDHITSPYTVAITVLESEERLQELDTRRANIDTRDAAIEHRLLAEQHTASAELNLAGASEIRARRDYEGAVRTIVRDYTSYESYMCLNCCSLTRSNGWLQSTSARTGRWFSEHIPESNQMALEWNDRFVVGHFNCDRGLDQLRAVALPFSTVARVRNSLIGGRVPVFLPILLPKLIETGCFGDQLMLAIVVCCWFSIMAVLGPIMYGVNYWLSYIALIGSYLLFRASFGYIVLPLPYYSIGFKWRWYEALRIDCSGEVNGVELLIRNLASYVTTKCVRLGMWLVCLVLLIIITLAILWMIPIGLLSTATHQNCYQSLMMGCYDRCANTWVESDKCLMSTHWYHGVKDSTLTVLQTVGGNFMKMPCWSSMSVVTDQISSLLLRSSLWLRQPTNLHVSYRQETQPSIFVWDGILNLLNIILTIVCNVIQSCVFCLQSVWILMRWLIDLLIYLVLSTTLVYCVWITLHLTPMSIDGYYLLSRDFIYHALGLHHLVSLGRY